MAVYKILQFPNSRLRVKGIPVESITDEIKTIIDNMFETHYSQENCAALAATQLDMPNPPRITVIDFSANKDQPLCLVNPEIIEISGEKVEEEGCMSVGLGGSIYEKVKRAEKIRVKALDRDGKPLDFEADGFMAKCIQHELDHLDGVLYIDHLGAIKRGKVNKQLEKLRKKQKK